MRHTDTKLGYGWRPDGHFLIRVNCVDCETEFDEYAMAPYTALCLACKRAQMYAAQMEREYQDILAAQESPKPFVTGKPRIEWRWYLRAVLIAAVIAGVTIWLMAQRIMP